jgi:hypothetical protein
MENAIAIATPTIMPTLARPRAAQLCLGIATSLISRRPATWCGIAAAVILAVRTTRFPISAVAALRGESRVRTRPMPDAAN